jgi:alkanesulfonate monooxygenase SsuD/methylene tetrahydromethanopterin reductase-like flavin-dependent oxidoreductase (luciferase family)
LGDPMDFGLALDFGHGTGTLQSRMDGVRPILTAAEEWGFRSVWAGESYVQSPQAVHTTSPLLLLAALAQVTHMRLGTGVLLLPAWDPVRLAYDANVLDNLSGGRLDLGVGLGSRELWVKFGHDPSTVGTLVDEAIDLLRSLWSGADGFQGTRLHVTGRMCPLPVQEGGPPLYVGGKIDRSLRRAAFKGNAYYASSSDLLDEIVARASRYHELLPTANGSRSGRVVANRLAFVAESGDEALAHAARFGGRVVDYYARVASSASQARMQAILERLGHGCGSSPQPARDPDGEPEGLLTELCLVGTPSEVYAQVERYRAAGVDALFLRVAPYDTPVEVALQTIELFGQHVMSRYTGSE